jgi:hypothetical protein
MGTSQTGAKFAAPVCFSYLLRASRYQELPDGHCAQRLFEDALIVALHKQLLLQTFDHALGLA